MDKQQVKLLREIKKAGLFDYSHLSANKREVLFYLRNNKYISAKANPTGHPRPIYKITELGKSELYELKIKNLHRWLPIAISLFAAIGAYRNEILWLLQAITKLLK